ncbi:MAG: DNA polymerase III subunit beta [Actinomycetaceae bacterium]|nr:DNA polymerase III subunit beta [Arcanobacterium sp.]MDD7505455.1 DNA polymerase III subunit beta [Actinomycetaceae bacterium]MDY6144046.1 DNA polymerase III subunit beta [Arcanobacterium sp.]
MKFQVNRDVFADAVTWVARTIPNRPAIPALAGLKINVLDEGTISLGSRDSDVSSHIDIEGDVIEAGEILVNGKLLAELVRVLPYAPITFSLVDNQVEIECGSSHISMKTMAMEDYSQLPPMPERIGQIDGHQWQEAVSQVSVAASNDDTLPMLVSICIEIEGSSMSLMATDRYRLAIRDLEWTPEDENISQRIMVRASRLLDVAKNIGSEGEIEVFLGVQGQSRLIGFSAGGRQNTIQLIDGDYPQVRSLFPENVNGYATVNRGEFNDVLRRSRLLVEKNAAVRLSFSEGELLVEAGQGDRAQISDALGAELDGDDISLAFNPAFLVEGIGVMNEDYVRLSFTQKDKPVVLNEQNDDGEVSQDFRLLLMPIRTFGSN